MAEGQRLTLRKKTKWGLGLLSLVIAVGIASVVVGIPGPKATVLALTAGVWAFAAFFGLGGMLLPRRLLVWRSAVMEGDAEFTRSIGDAFSQAIGLDSDGLSSDPRVLRRIRLIGALNLLGAVLVTGLAIAVWQTL